MGNLLLKKFYFITFFEILSFKCKIWPFSEPYLHNLSISAYSAFSALPLHLYRATDLLQAAWSAVHGHFCLFECVERFILQIYPLCPILHLQNWPITIVVGFWPEWGPTAASRRPGTQCGTTKIHFRHRPCLISVLARFFFKFPAI